MSLNTFNDNGPSQRNDSPPAVIWEYPPPVPEQNKPHFVRRRPLHNTGSPSTLAEVPRTTIDKSDYQYPQSNNLLKLWKGSIAFLESRFWVGMKRQIHPEGSSEEKVWGAKVRKTSKFGQINSTKYTSVKMDPDVGKSVLTSQFSEKDDRSNSCFSSKFLN